MTDKKIYSKEERALWASCMASMCRPFIINDELRLPIASEIADRCDDLLSIYRDRFGMCADWSGKERLRAAQGINNKTEYDHEKFARGLREAKK